MRTSMRFILVLLVLGVGVHIGTNAIKSVDQIQEQRMEALCKVDPELCQSTNWPHLPRKGHFHGYNKSMNKTNELKSYFGGRVLANETAMKDPAVIAAFQAMQQRNWEELKTPCGGTWNISDRH